jgi:hypothetical protein
MVKTTYELDFLTADFPAIFGVKPRLHYAQCLVPYHFFGSCTT